MTVASLRQSVRNNVWWGVRLPTVGKRQASNAGPKPTRFVSAAGNDNNDGLTPATAWATITKANAATLNSNDVVAFRGGDTFTGTITPQRDGTAAASLVFTSYGVGQATISSGTASGYYALNRSYVTADNLNFVGNGTTNNTYGVWCSNSQAGDTKLPGNVIQYCAASGYGLDGIVMTGDTGLSGFATGMILNCVAFGNCFGNPNGNGSSGIRFFSNSATGYGHATCHTNPLIRGCIAHDNPGGPDTTNWSGSGIVVSESTNPLIDNCIAHNNSLNCATGGVVGIWFYDCNGGIIQHCESYSNGRFVSTDTDGTGFDLDGGCVNCTIQYCYSHDNSGAGFIAYSYEDGFVAPWSGNTIRFNISYNDCVAGRKPTNVGGILITSDSPMTGLNVHNNVVYQTNAPQPCLGITIRSSVTGNIGNNILIHTGGGKQVYWLNTGTPTIAMLGNCYYGPSGVSLDWKGTNYSTFAAWQAASGLEKISGSNVAITSNPQLASPGTAGIMGGWNADRLAGYKPTTGSPCIAGGVDLHAQFGLTMPAVDLFGNANPGSAPYACGVTAHT